jgi:hypothetical protein
MVSGITGAVQSTLSAAKGIIAESLNFADTILDAPCDIASVIGIGVDSILQCTGQAGTVVDGGIIGKCSGELYGDIYQLDGDYIPEKLTLAVIRALLSASDYDETYCVPTMPQTQLDNARAMVDVFKGACIKQACTIAIRGAYTSRERAQESLDYISGYIEAFLLRLGSWDRDSAQAYQSMEDLRNIFVAGMYELMTGLEQLTEYVPPTDGITPLALAYARYNDVNRESEIFDMNKSTIKNPCFITGGNMINILDQ